MLTNTYNNLIAYCPDLGEFYWLVDRGNQVKAGDLAGSKNKNGYLFIAINKKKYIASRLAWFCMTGRWPTHEVDHKNRDPLDNRWCNLREATRAQNAHNKAKYSNNRSGYKGVSWSTREQKWCAKIRINGIGTHLGYFNDPKEAHLVYKSAAKKYHGEFANA